MRPDFTACGNEFLNRSGDLYSHYVYNGSVRGILHSNRPPLITLQGCRELCGTGIAYYPWKDSSNTITTWVLPIIGLLVQAPFESNQAWQTTLSLARWSGSPIASLSYIFWNIKVTGKCALMVDMSTKYEEFPDENSEFSHMRDSLYILMIMNQYSAKQSMPPVEAERLLRLALFSNLLQLKGTSDPRDNVLYRRTELAKNLREGRKKGVVPVFISFLWFMFALILTIDLAFGDIGNNETAHNLAMGFLVGWLPIMILASTVDRNQASADSIREKLNDLVDDVRLALLNPDVLDFYKKDTQTTDEDFAWMGCLSDEHFFNRDFFTGFGGQGRTHFHYGVAHPLLAGIETKFIADYGRDWLRNGFAARQAIVVGSRNINGLKMFDPRMVWQITSSIFIVYGCVFGAFILSWFTPTVGLGCRSGGYLVYVCIALGLLVIELLVWWLTHETTHTPEDLMARVSSRLQRHLSRGVNREKVRADWPRLHACLSWFTTVYFRDVMKNFFIIPCEICNTIWLLYIIFAQTFGSYQTCECMASTWARAGGFIDFETFQDYKAKGVFVYWGAATGLSLFVMTVGLIYVVVEYCEQSHMSTENYARAMTGLRHTRWFKKHTRFIRFLPNRTIAIGKWIWWKIDGGKSRKGRRSLVWTVHTKKHHDEIHSHDGYSAASGARIGGPSGAPTTGEDEKSEQIRSRVVQTSSFTDDSPPPRTPTAVDLEKCEVDYSHGKS